MQLLLLNKFNKSEASMFNSHFPHCHIYQLLLYLYTWKVNFMLITSDLFVAQLLYCQLPLISQWIKYTMFLKVLLHQLPKNCAMEATTSPFFLSAIHLAATKQQHASVHLHPHWPGGHPGQQCRLGTLLPRTWHPAWHPSTPPSVREVLASMCLGQCL